MAKCIECGKELENNKKKFCSERCRSREYEKRRPPRRFSTICSYCGKEYLKKGRKKEEGKESFCSYECFYNFKKQHKEIKKCIICGKEFESLRKSHVCCSRPCRTKYTFLRKERTCKLCGKKFKIEGVGNYCSKECIKKAQILSMERRIKEGKFKQTDTAPHKKIKKILKENNIDFENEKRFGKFFIDIFIENNYCVEIMGSYWHQDCRRFPPESFYESQKEAVKKDKRKNFLLKEKFSKDILYLWEIDINENIELCEKLIKKFLKNKGKLKKYHSSNYFLSKDKKLHLKLNRQQYMEL